MDRPPRKGGRFAFADAERPGEPTATDSLSLFAEYNYVALGEAEYAFPSEVFEDSNAIDAAMALHTIKAGVSIGS